jgi:hypothetical protein
MNYYDESTRINLNLFLVDYKIALVTSHLELFYLT